MKKTGDSVRPGLPVFRRGVLRAWASMLVTACIAVALAASGASGRDLDEIKKTGVLRHLGIPYANFVTGSGDGMDVELVKLFARRIGVRYEYVKTDWDDVIGDLTGKKVRPKGSGIETIAAAPVKGDIIANGMTVIPWRSKVVAFSTPTFPTQVWLVARADSPLAPIKPSGNVQQDIAAVKSLLKSRSLLCKSNTCLDPALYNIDATGAKVVLFKGSLNELAPAVLNREAELTLLDLPDALVALQKWPGKIKVIGPISEVRDMAAAFRHTSPKLREEFDALLEELKRSGEFRKIAAHYYPFVLDYHPSFFKLK